MTGNTKAEMTNSSINLLLADDDLDDCMFFRDVLEELPISSNLRTVNDGEELIKHLKSESKLPDALFLDLNMPKKNGIECLTEIKNDKRLISIPIIIYSTSLDKEVVNLLYEYGACRYVRKPGDFAKLKSVIHEVLNVIVNNEIEISEKENFVL